VKNEDRVVRNVTISMDDDLVRRAKVEAARQDKSLSKFIAELLEREVGHSQAYQKAMESYLSRHPFQASLLESMEERQVSVEGEAHPLPDPFAVIATQNPIEYEGTYPLPEAQLDRFLFKLQVGYPTAEQEQEVLARHDRGLDPHDLAASGLRAVATAEHLAEGRRRVEALLVEEPVLAYVVAIVRATRESPSLALGVSPRGGASLLKAAKAWAWLAGRDFVTPDEVKAVALPALRHRLLLRPELVLEGVTADGVLQSILATVPAPR